MLAVFLRDWESEYRKPLTPWGKEGLLGEEEDMLF